MSTAAAPLLTPVAPAPAPMRWLGRLVDWTVIVIGATMALMVFVNVALHLVRMDLAWVTEFGELLCCAAQCTSGCVMGGSAETRIRRRQTRGKNENENTAHEKRQLSFERHTCPPIA